MGSLIGDVADAAGERRNRQSRSEYLGSIIASIQESELSDDRDLDMAADLASIQQLVETGASFDEVARQYAVLVGEARQQLAEVVVDPNTGTERPKATPAEMAAYLARIRREIRLTTGYDMPDVTLLVPPKAAQTAEEEETPSDVPVAERLYRTAFGPFGRKPRPSPSEEQRAKAEKAP
jgi:hypothetical protein